MCEFSIAYNRTTYARVRFETLPSFSCLLAQVNHRELNRENNYSTTTMKSRMKSLNNFLFSKNLAQSFVYPQRIDVDRFFSAMKYSLLSTTVHYMFAATENLCPQMQFVNG